MEPDIETYPRDLIGYGRDTPDPEWPGDAYLALQVVVNYEEGGENSILHGDTASEAFLSDIAGAVPWPGQRHMNMESMYEYGSRAGFWRLWRLFTARRFPVTVYGVATALERNRGAVAAMREAGWEIASHGLKWIEYKDFTRDAERDHMLEAIRIHTGVTGQRPLGWYTGRCSPHTLGLVMEEGGFLYSSDSYADDLPYWVAGPSSPKGSDDKRRHHKKKQGGVSARHYESPEPRRVMLEGACACKYRLRDAPECRTRHRRCTQRVWRMSARASPHSHITMSSTISQ